jgi:hypothetical protein
LQFGNTEQLLNRNLQKRSCFILVVVDGVVDEPLMRAKLPHRPDSFFTRPADIADTIVMITQQKRSAWTFELDLRPFLEKW